MRARQTAKINQNFYASLFWIRFVFVQEKMEEMVSALIHPILHTFDAAFDNFSANDTNLEGF